MASRMARMAPRSVLDATRFTSTLPHAASKTAVVGRVASPAASKQSPRVPGETPEQRVQRLRKAHEAAQQAQISSVDRMVEGSRKFFDVAHRWTVRALIFFTILAGFVSVYSVWDMLQFNSARRAEWIEAQKKFEADELALARIAYLRGDATDEQIELVEEVNRRAQEKGIKLPPLLDTPEHRTHFEERVMPTFSGAETEHGVKEEKKTRQEGKGIWGVVTGLFGGSKKTESHSASAESVTVGDAGMVQSIETKARDAWETEKQNQVQGGSLDQLGLEQENSKSEKRGWRLW
ncbi:hypothetical protein E4U30_003032 [Claviceps sp. LM220 group G6]|nr:hypothetical protein E4U30_003032 [Claviceps sp. LM220 group G6]